MTTCYYDVCVFRDFTNRSNLFSSYNGEYDGGDVSAKKDHDTSCDEEECHSLQQTAPTTLIMHLTIIYNSR